MWGRFGAVAGSVSGVDLRSMCRRSSSRSRVAELRDSAGSLLGWVQAVPEASSAGEARPSAELAALATWISSAPIGGEPLDELRAVLLEARSVASAAAAASRGHGEAAALRQVCAALAEALGRSDRLARDLATLEGEHARRQEDVARAMAARLRAQDKVLARRSEHLAALACAQRLRQRRRRGRLAPTASDEEPPGDGDALL